MHILHALYELGIDRYHVELSIRDKGGEGPMRAKNFCCKKLKTF